MATSQRYIRSKPSKASSIKQKSDDGKSQSIKVEEDDVKIDVKFDIKMDANNDYLDTNLEKEEQKDEVNVIMIQIFQLTLYGKPFKSSGNMKIFKNKSSLSNL